MNNQNTHKLVYSSLMVAIIMLATAFFKVPLAYGYFNLGDGCIFLAAQLLSTPAIVVAALGSALADLIAGYTVYIPATLIIKGLMAFIAIKFASGKPLMRQTLVFLLAEAVMVLGYLAFETVLYGFAGALGSIPANLLQAVAGTASGVLLCAVAPRIKKVINL